MANKVEDRNLIDKENELRLFTKADELRKKQVGKKVTFVKNRNINFTDKCGIQCDFCSFHKKNGSFLSIEDIKKKIEENEEIKEVCLQGAINPDLDFEYYIKLVKEIKNNYEVHVHAFSPQEIYSMSDTSIKTTLKKLKKAGLDSIPGTAAEILDDEVRKIICPQKITSQQWEEIIKKAHELGIKTTSTMMYGHVENWEHRINHIYKIKRIQEQTNGFTEFIPLPFIDQNGEKQTTFRTDLKVISLSRVLLGDSIKNIQASWVKLGLDKAIESLYFGANDLGGTLIEENITSLERDPPSPQKLVKEIREANRIPVERNTLYKEVKKLDT